jgi:hypothetical protein
MLVNLGGDERFPRPITLLLGCHSTSFVWGEPALVQVRRRANGTKRASSEHCFPKKGQASKSLWCSALHASEAAGSMHGEARNELDLPMIPITAR